MSILKLRLGTLSLVVCAAMILTLATGCPATKSGTASVSTVLSADRIPAKSLLLSALAGDYAKADDVPLEDILSLTVTLEKITIVPEDCDGECDGEGDDHPMVFEGPQDVDLADLESVSQLISTADVPAGTYKQIRLWISNPRMVLKADETTVITDIHLTANSRLFITQEFDLPANSETVLSLDLNGLKVVTLGNGSYNWTPQLDVALEVSVTSVTATGVIEAVPPDTEPQQFTMLMGTESVTVDYSAAAIWLPTDVDTASGTEADLLVGTSVIVTGLYTAEGILTADAIEIQEATTP